MTILIRKINSIIFIIIIIIIIGECKSEKDIEEFRRINAINHDHDRIQTYYSKNNNKSDSNRKLTFAVLLPWNFTGLEDLRQMGPAALVAINLAVEHLQKPGNIFYYYDISIIYRDTECSSVTGPLAAFDIIYTHRKPGLNEKLLE